MLVIIPNFEYRYLVAKKSRKSGRPRYWTINGQGLYNATLHYRLRAKITDYYHRYLSKYIKNQISKEDIQNINRKVYPGSSHKLSTALEIYDIKRGNMPDVGNLWLWIKWFEDSLQSSGVIPDDNMDYIRESGRIKHHFVDDPDNRKLVFIIKIIES